jgi:hypothetical protein
MRWTALIPRKMAFATTTSRRALWGGGEIALSESDDLRRLPPAGTVTEGVWDLDLPLLDGNEDFVGMQIENPKRGIRDLFDLFAVQKPLALHRLPPMG